MSSVLSAFTAALQSWPASVLVLLLTVAFLASGRLAIASWRPSLPSTAPRLLRGWPLLGSTDFFRARNDFLIKGKKRNPSGQFSFYYGPHPIVALSGPSARSFFYTARGLDLSAGFAALFAASPSIDHLHPGEGDGTSHFILMFKRFMHRDRLAASLGHLTADTRAALESIDPSAPLEPFGAMMNLVYRLTHRTLGSNDIADDPKLLTETLAAYRHLDTSSAVDVMFPGLPTPNRLRRMWAGARLHSTLKSIMDDRRQTGRTENDAMQAMMDQGDGDLAISTFIIGALFAGLINSGFNAAWILCFLANDTHWHARMRAEVDAVVASHRLFADETPAQILPRLSLDEWESLFPLIDLGLRDSIRIITRAVSIRKNVSGKDIEIGDTGQVIPNNAFAVYGMEDIHMNGQLYQDPTKWDPGRYLPGREEDKKAPYAYLGWGSGLHPCLGMRFAKLEITISTAMFLAYYDFHRCDKHGNYTKEPLPHVNRNAIGTKRPVRNIFLKCTPRF